jgi:hypothetical protein
MSRYHEQRITVETEENTYDHGKLTTISVSSEETKIIIDAHLVVESNSRYDFIAQLNELIERWAL